MEKCFVGLDFGGTSIKAVAIDDEGSILGSDRIATPTEGAESVLEAIYQISRSVAKDALITGVGIAVPGVVDMNAGVVKFIPNVPGAWNDRPLAAELSDRLQVPCALLNDARAATYGELKYGAGRDCRNFALLTVGTGIGGGIVLNGDLFLGSTGNAGEVGHQIIDLHGPRCGCGGWGCGEVFASGSALAASAMRVITQGLGSAQALRSACGGDVGKMTARLVLETAAQKDPLACQLVKEEGVRLAAVISNLIVVLNPERIIVGGGVSLAGDLLLDEVRNSLNDRIGRFLLCGPVDIVPAELGDNAGALGSAAWERRLQTT